MVTEEFLKLGGDREGGSGAGDDEGGELVGAGCECVSWDEAGTGGGGDGREIRGEGNIVECYWERG